MATRSGYLSISQRGIDFDSVPMRLFQKSKKLGTWDGMAFDLTQDRRDWETLDQTRRDDLIGTTTLFQAGEEAVTLDLLPLVMAVARQGRLEEEIYLTSFLWEEAKHTEFFRRWLDEVPRIGGQDLHDYIGPNYRTLFFEELPTAMGRLLSDQSNEALARALTTYNMMIEGVLAETGYHSYSKLLEAGRLFPGLAGALKLISRDESRHIRFGVYMLQLLIQQDGAMWDVVQRRMEELMPIVLGIVGPPAPEEGEIPVDSVFAADPDEMSRFAMTQYQRRMHVLERARGQSLAELEEEVSDELTEEFFAN
jgi:ribonucleoside-diphosphate reductase beta chain